MTMNNVGGDSSRKHDVQSFHTLTIFSPLGGGVSGARRALGESSEGRFEMFFELLCASSQTIEKVFALGRHLLVNRHQLVNR